MRRLILLLLSLSLLLTSCAGASGQAAAGDGKLRITATIFPQYDFLRHIVGDKAHVTLLLPPGTESHSFEPTARDILGIQRSDVFVQVGGMSDAWVDRILDSASTEGMERISLINLVEVVKEELVEGMESDHEHGGNEDRRGPSHDAEYDEHVWTSPKNAMVIVEALRDRLCVLDPDNADTYRANAEAYLQELSALDNRFTEVVAAGTRDIIVFGDRFPFRYFVDAYGLDYYAAFPGCAAESEASAATVAFLIDKVRTKEIPAVFHIELSNETMVNVICEDTGAEKLLFHSCHNLSQSDFEAGENYISLMNRNAENLAIALGNGKRT